jgi:hypothetical protein
VFVHFTKADALHMEHVFFERKAAQTAEFDGSTASGHGHDVARSFVALVYGTVRQHGDKCRLARRLQPNRLSARGASGRVCDMATTIGKFSIWSAIAVLVIALVAVAWVLAR